MFGFLAALSVMFLSPSAAFAGLLTESSRIAHYVQLKYAGTANLPYPILIFDRDELDWRFLRARAFTEDDSLRKKIIQQYVREKTGYEASENDAGNFDDYLTKLRDGANALPILENGNSGPVKFCAVFPADPNSNKRLETERVLQLTTPGLFQKDYSQIKSPMSHKQLTMLSLFHELSHCLDTRFFPANYNGHTDPGADDIHRSESFAETLALLLLTKEGMNDLGPARSAYRALYSRVVGPFLASQVTIDPNRSFGGPIYYLSPSIEAAQKTISSEGEQIRFAPVPSLMDRAEAIVRENAFSFQVLNLIKYAFTDGKEAAIDRSTRFEIDFPTLFIKTTEKLTGFFGHTDNVLATFFSESAASVTAKPLKEIKMEEFCADFLDGNAVAFFTRLEELREDLMEENGIPEAQRQRAADLAGIFGLTNRSCGARTRR